MSVRLVGFVHVPDEVNVVLGVDEGSQLLKNELPAEPAAADVRPVMCPYVSSVMS